MNETINETKKKLNKKLISGIALVVVAIVIGVSATVNLISSDKFIYRDIVTTSAPFVYNEDQIKDLNPGDECYLILGNIDMNESGDSFKATLLDEDKNKVDADLVIEAPLISNCVTDDLYEVIVRAEYIERTRLTICGLDIKAYQFKALNVADLDNDFKIDGEVKDVSVLGRNSKLKVGDKISGLLTAGPDNCAEYTEYKGEPYTVFKYVDIDYDYDMISAEYEVRSDKKFIIKNDDPFFHMELLTDYEEINSIKNIVVESGTLSIANAKIVDSNDEYYVLSIDEVDPVVYINNTENGGFTFFSDKYTLDEYVEIFLTLEDIGYDQGTVEKLLYSNDETIEDYKKEILEANASVESSEDSAAEETSAEVVDAEEDTSEVIYYFVVDSIVNPSCANIIVYASADDLFNGENGNMDCVYMETDNVYSGYTGTCSSYDVYTEDGDNMATIAYWEYLDLESIYGYSPYDYGEEGL